MQMNYPLVSAAPELKRQILLFLDKFSVYQRINIGKHFLCHFRKYFAARNQVHIIQIACITPDAFLRISFTDFFQKLHHLHLVLRFKRFSPQQRKSCNIRRLQSVYNLCLRLSRIRLSIVEIPCLCIKASFAVMAAPGDKEAYSHSRAICYIIFFNISICLLYTSPSPRD